MTPHLTPHLISQSPPAVPPSDEAGAAGRARPALALDIAGGDLMLRGRFRDWEAVLSLGPDLDHAGLRLAVDATSTGLGLGGGDEAPAAPLFSFRSRNVETVGGGAFRAEGTLTGEQGGRSVEMTVETPPGHTALFVLSFGANKDDFQGGWHDVIQNAAPFGGNGADGEPVRLAAAWLTPPVLAAA